MPVSDKIQPIWVHTELYDFHVDLAKLKFAASTNSPPMPGPVWFVLNPPCILYFLPDTATNLAGHLHLGPDHWVRVLTVVPVAIFPVIVAAHRPHCDPKLFPYFGRGWHGATIQFLQMISLVSFTDHCTAYLDLKVLPPALGCC